MSDAPVNPSLLEEITEMEMEWAAAIQGQDAAAMQAILADDSALVVGIQGQPLKIVAREPLLATLPGYQVESFSIDDIRVTAYGDVVVAVMLYTQKATADGQDRSAQFLLTDIWVKTPTGWRVAERHSSRPEPPPLPPALAAGGSVDAAPAA
jgi:ketosteroid isomerase-like protein